LIKCLGVFVNQPRLRSGTDPNPPLFTPDAGPMRTGLRSLLFIDNYNVEGLKKTTINGKALVRRLYSTGKVASAALVNGTVKIQKKRDLEETEVN
jgi:hypothetical protein